MWPRSTRRRCQHQAVLVDDRRTLPSTPESTSERSSGSIRLLEWSYVFVLIALTDLALAMEKESEI